MCIFCFQEPGRPPLARTRQQAVRDQQA